jgi:hypothetical protein
LETNKEKNMKMKIAILAACVGTVALAQADIARANYAAAYELKSFLRISDVRTGPVFVRAITKASSPSRYQYAQNKPLASGTIRLAPQERPFNPALLKSKSPGTSQPSSSVQSPKKVK